MNENTGHGHVFPRPDGVRARCGGPAICSECAADLARKEKGGQVSIDLSSEVARLRDGIEEICKHRGTPPTTRARLRHLVAGVDWKKVR